MDNWQIIIIFFLARPSRCCLNITLFPRSVTSWVILLFVFVTLRLLSCFRAFFWIVAGYVGMGALLKKSLSLCLSNLTLNKITTGLFINFRILTFSACRRPDFALLILLMTERRRPSVFWSSKSLCEPELCKVRRCSDTSRGSNIRL